MLVIRCVLLFCICALLQDAESKKFEAFVGDIIDTWQFLSPTIIFKSDLPRMCMTHQWLLCYANDLDAQELANQLVLIHRGRKLDGLIIQGRHGHKKLLKHLMRVAPFILASNYPVFMPSSYKDDIELRLDSNIVFYSDKEGGNYELNDIFAAKGGPTLTLNIGKWNHHDGIALIKSIHRWERRTNLHQTTFVNCIANRPPLARVIKDKHGNILGSEGASQDILFYITDKLNLTIKTVESTSRTKLLNNGSWTGLMGLLQRRKVDLYSTGLGVTLERSYFIDYPIPVSRFPITLIAAIPEGTSPNMWVYVRVFGVYQWLIFVILLVFIAMELSLINATCRDLAGWEFGTKRGSSKNYQINSASSALSMVCLYTIQMGSHTSSKKISARLLTLTMSILTLLFFAFYTTDITAEMTSGPPKIPISTFEDVLHNEYKVVTYAAHFEKFLASSKPGSAKLKVYKNQFERKRGWTDSLNAVVDDSDSKTLLYSNPNSLMPKGHSKKMLANKVFALQMDDNVYSLSGLALQKDSEFLQIFNYYILRAVECGELKRLHYRYYTDLYTKENFEMVKPKPLGFNNVMFCFICLGFGMFLSLLQVLLEVITKKFSGEQDPKRP